MLSMLWSTNRRRVYGNITQKVNIPTLLVVLDRSLGHALGGSGLLERLVQVAGTQLWYAGHGAR